MDLGCPDSVKTTENYISLSPPPAKTEAAPKAQLLVVLSALWRPIHRSQNIYLAIGKERI